MKNRFRNLLILLFTLLLVPNFNNFVAKASNELRDKNDKELTLEKNLYILGPGDVLSIKFTGIEELSGTYFIMRDGNIQLPLLGTKSINKLTLDGAKKKLIELYSDDLIRPEIDLNLIKPRPIRVSLIGEVQRPGSYTFNMGESSRVKGSEGSGTLITGYQTVVDAIQKSGGLTFDADITNVVLYRKLPGENVEYKKTNLDLLNMIRTGNQINNPILFDGDSIKVSKYKSKINSLEKIPNNLTPETIKIHVIGQVESPGLYNVDAKTQISQAILIAGGPKSWRYKDKIQLLRLNRNGSVEVKKISFNKQGLSKKSNSIALRNGDIIRVKKNFFGKSTDALGTFLPPIRDMYSLYGIYKLLE